MGGAIILSLYPILLYFDERFPPLTNISFQYEEGINEMY